MKIPMETISRADLIAALAEVVREMLEKGEDVTLAGLGTLRVHHQPSQVDEGPDDSLIMKPPRDVVAFSTDL